MNKSVGTINWLPCLLWEADHTPITGVAWNDAALVVQYQKQGGAVIVKALAVGDWDESVGMDGIYSIRFTAAECDTLGNFIYHVVYTAAVDYPGVVELNAESPTGPVEYTHTVLVGVIPIDDAYVAAFTEVGLTNKVADGRTNSDGKVVFNLDPDTYWIQVSKSGYNFPTASVGVS